MIGQIITPILGLIDKIIPDPKAREAAKLELLKAENQQEIERLRISMSAILAEAQSTDPWTSRARPTFLYVFYLILLMCCAGAIIGIWWPTEVKMAATNLADLLNAIPEELWWLFGTGYLGYTGFRSFEKTKKK